jgi:Protein of unknown function (DUF3102)
MTAHQLKPRPTVTPAEHRARKEAARALREQSPNYYAIQKYSGLRYNYGQIDEAHRQQVQEAALDIGRRLRRTVEDMIEIGRQLGEVKALIPGKFSAWLKAEFAMSNGSAHDFMNFAERVEEFPIIGNFGITVARLLAAPNVPESVINAVVEATEAKGSPLLVREVNMIKRELMPPKPKPAKQLSPPPEPEPETIEAEYTVAPKHEFIFPAHEKRADEVRPVISRALAAKLRDGVLHRIFRLFLTGEEADELLVALTRALEGE